MVKKRSTFTTNQMQILVEAGKRAEKLLHSHIAWEDAERHTLEVQVKTGKAYEKMIEKHKSTRNKTMRTHSSLITSR